MRTPGLYRGRERMGDIAAVLGISLPATTIVTVRLDGKGLVSRIIARGVSTQRSR